MLLYPLWKGKRGKCFFFFSNRWNLRMGHVTFGRQLLLMHVSLLTFVLHSPARRVLVGTVCFVRLMYKPCLWCNFIIYVWCICIVLLRLRSAWHGYKKCTRISYRFWLTDVPNGLSGSTTLQTNTLMTFSLLSCSGLGGPPIRASPSPRSKDTWNMGISTYCKAWRKQKHARKQLLVCHV